MYRKKHSILKALYDFYEFQEKKKFNGSGPTEFGQTLTVVELNNRTKIVADDIQKVCYALINAGHVQLYQKDEKNSSHRYIITNSGRQAFIDNFYRNQTWYVNKDFWLKVIPILISIGALLWVIYSNYDLKVEVKQQKNEIIYLKNQLKNIK